MSKLKINKELLRGIAEGWEVSEQYEVVSNKLCGRSRWSVHYECIIKDKTTGKFYDASYSDGATESQYEESFEDYETDSNGYTELNEVFPYEKTVIRYRKVK